METCSSEEAVMYVLENGIVLNLTILLKKGITCYNLQNSTGLLRFTSRVFFVEMPLVAKLIFVQFSSPVLFIRLYIEHIERELGSLFFPPYLAIHLHSILIFPKLHPLSSHCCESYKLFTMVPSLMQI